MKEDYVSFEIAKLLKEKGFDEPCDFIYDGDKLEWIFYKFIFMNGILTNSKFDDDKIVSAPTLQMAMKWLREKYKIFIEVSVSVDTDKVYHYSFCILNEICRYLKRGDKVFYRTYEEAVEKAIKYCLTNLI